MSNSKLKTHEDKITRFTGNRAFLSNFHPSSLRYEGGAYPAVEHAYQAMKTTNLAARIQFQSLISSGEAKRRGRKLELRSDWEEVKLGIMLHLLRLKFQDPQLRSDLLLTGTAELIEGNAWGDSFWGVVRVGTALAHGENHLGRLLMQVRDEIRNGGV